jgi:hypothetical protein
MSENPPDDGAGQHETAAASALASLGGGEQPHSDGEDAGPNSESIGDTPTSFQRKVRTVDHSARGARAVTSMYMSTKTFMLLRYIKFLIFILLLAFRNFLDCRNDTNSFISQVACFVG